MSIVSDKIQAARKSKGLSQDELSQQASINLRTLQRIENGKTEPRGYTLRAIATALEMPLESFMASDEKNEQPADKGFLQLMVFSSLSFWLFPLAHIFVPMVLRHWKKNSVHGVEALGSKITRFQLWWSLITYSILLSGLLLAIVHPAFMNPLLPFYLMITVGLLYIINSVYIFVEFLKIRKNNHSFLLSGPV